MGSAGTAAVLVAAGRGRRMEQEMPKQYLPVAGKPILRRTVETFLDCPEISLLIVVIHPEDRDLYESAVKGISDGRLLEPVDGGHSRSASVQCGLAGLMEYGPERVLIHDAARPFCPRHVIDGVIRGLDRAEGAFAALPVVDAIWRGRDGHADASVPREGLWRAQTPQGFRFDRIVEAHRACEDTVAADDVAIARAAGMGVVIVPGCETNIKITAPADLERAEEIVQLTENEISASASRA